MSTPRRSGSQDPIACAMSAGTVFGRFGFDAYSVACVRLVKGERMEDTHDERWAVREVLLANRVALNAAEVVVRPRGELIVS